LPGYERFPFSNFPWNELYREGRRLGETVCVKASRSRRVYRVQSQDPSTGPPGQVMYVKRYLINTPRRWLSNRLRGSRAAREFTLGLRLAAAGLPVPTPLAHAAHRAAFRPAAAEGAEGLPPASYLVTRACDGRGSVRTWMKSRPELREPLMGAVARFVAWCHAHGFQHDDLSVDHVIVAGDPAEETAWDRPVQENFALIDIDDGRLTSRPVALAGRMINLYQILRSLSFVQAAPKLRDHFLIEYLRASGQGERLTLAECKTALERVARRRGRASVLFPRPRT